MLERYRCFARVSFRIANEYTVSSARWHGFRFRMLLDMQGHLESIDASLEMDGVQAYRRIDETGRKPMASSVVGG